MSLYTKPITSITWSDIETFCQQRNAEGATLDYKADFPGDLERTISAMANTLGGVILIGVAEDREAKPVLPVAGVAFQRGLSERVTSVCLDNITPPVIPETQVCTSEDAGRAFLVVRVPQSTNAPHAIRSNTRVYIRAGRQNDPEPLADLPRIEWLMNHRKKSEAFRDWLLIRADTRFALARDGRVAGIDATTETERTSDGQQPCLMTLALCPTYPVPEPLIAAPDLERVRREIRVRDLLGTSYEFPIQEGVNRLVEDGLIMHLSGGGGLRTYHTHLNIHGLYFHKQSVLLDIAERRAKGQRTYEAQEDVAPGAIRFVVRSSELIDRMTCVLDSALKFYRSVNYVGPLMFRMRLERVLGYPMEMYESSAGFIETHLRFSADPEIDAIQFLSTTTLEETKIDAVLYFMRRVGWAFDWDFTKKALADHYRERGYTAF